MLTENDKIIIGCLGAMEKFITNPLFEKAEGQVLHNVKTGLPTKIQIVVVPKTVRDPAMDKLLVKPKDKPNPLLPVVWEPWPF